MIRKASLIWAALLSALAVQAAPVTYNLSFQIEFGATLPTAGSFTYDSSLAVDPFSSFTVTEGGVVFDLTTAANNPGGGAFTGVCFSSDSAAGFFNGLTGPGCEPSWIYAPQVDTNFEIYVCSTTSNCDDADASAFVRGTAGAGVFTSGLVVVTPATTVPEPSALGLSAMGALMLALAAVWKRQRPPAWFNFGKRGRC